MIAANYNNTFNNQLLNSIAYKARSFVEFHAYDSPLLNQWHHLISTIRASANTRQWVTLINPPFIPNDQYLTDIGLGDHYVRVIRLENTSAETTKYIQRCLQNGKSSVVAVWSNSNNELPEILLNDSPLSCQALVFSQSKIAAYENQQLEIAF